MSNLVSFTGSSFLVPTPEVQISFRAEVRDRVAEFSLEPSSKLHRKHAFVRRKNKAIDPRYDLRLLRSLLSGFSDQRREQVALHLEELLGSEPARTGHPQEEPLYEQLTEEELGQLRDRRNLEIPGIKKKIKKLGDLVSVLEASRRSCQPAAEIPRLSDLSPARTRYLLRQLKKTRGEAILQAHRQAQQRLLKQTVVSELIGELLRDDSFLELTVSEAHEHLLGLLPDDFKLSRSSYYALLRESGARFRNLRYEPLIARPVAPEAVRYFLPFLEHLMVEQKKFRVIFLDETSVCQGNFRQSRWCPPGRSNRVRSRLRYERLTVVGAMDAEGVIGVRLLVSGFSGRDFLLFVRELLEEVCVRQEESRQVVLLMDNSSCHHGAALRPLLAAYKTVGLYNLPHCSQFNPIELLWEHGKRPLRRLSTYPAFTYQQSLSRGTPSHQTPLPPQTIRTHLPPSNPQVHRFRKPLF